METITRIPHEEKDNFVTVVSVGAEASRPLSSKCDSFSSIDSNSGFVTVLTIGDSDDCVSKDIIEKVLVYRLPGERLGFGLKFEGGTKANEFVKRLFIQSCAPDSPASRVQSSWGKLSEGDEVLEIDSMSVNTMTRIDCVRCLKDSNVVINLLVRHPCDKVINTDSKQTSDVKTRSIEDLPQVVSAEKKRTPPPPPPVPPRKIPKKFYKHSAINHQENANETNPVPAVRQINAEVVISVKNKKFQSPRSSGRSSYSPDIPRRDRRFSDGSLGPPDAEIYVDLFSQESTQSLSESDDTGSSISTVVDRFASFPTTTTSSLAGSLPSTPTSVQRHLDFSNLLNTYDDEELSTALNKNLIKQSVSVAKSTEINEKVDKSEEKTVNEDGIPLQPPSCFQDAPLSYGNEDMRIIETKSNDVDACDSQPPNNKYTPKNGGFEEKLAKKPPVPPRSRDLINAHHKMNGCKEFHDENMNISNLPRLVDFVPKSVNGTHRDFSDNSADIIRVFLENERRDAEYFKNNYMAENDDALDDYSDEIDLFNSKWNLTSQLATIGEVEEEGNQESVVNRSPSNSTPIVIVDSADSEETDSSPNSTQDEICDEDINGKMETLPSDSRQPPDGHEFPDYVETNSKAAHNELRQFDEEEIKTSEIMKTYESVNSSQNRSSFNDFSSVPIHKSLNKINSVSNSDLSLINSKDSFDSGDEVTLRRNSLEPSLHTRSQSLIDMSAISKHKSDRWSLLVEQRRKGLSKLKGLVIPEHITENEAAPAVNIPEIISQPPSFVLETKINVNQTTHNHSNDTEPVILPLTSPPWTSNSSAIPKYSPAFKRKSLQVYPPPSKNQKEERQPQQISTPPAAINKLPVKTSLNSATIKQKIDDELRLDNLSDAPKSLESITSPTRSDCSFDYVTNSFGKIKSNKQELQINRIYKESPNYISKLHKDLGKSEDESDNDSAVSSSQSSYISRCSPPPSPTRSCEMLDYESRSKSDTIQDMDKYSNSHCRLLKPASVEAINRKNILASAKCRSGRDLKVGSPVIQRKYDDDDSTITTNTAESQILVNNKPPVNKQDETPTNIRTAIKERRSISCEESTPKTMVNGNLSKTNDTARSSVALNKTPEKITFVALKPVADSPRSLSKGYPEPKIIPRNDYTRTRSLSRNNNKAMSVTDLRKSFENFGSSPPPLPQNVSVIIVKETKIKNAVKAVGKNDKAEKNLPEKKPRRIEESAKPETVKTSPPQKPVCEEKGEVSVDNNRRKVVLCPEFVGGSIGVTLAGGTDYETKEITIHKIRYGSVAYNDGQLKKGDRIISINGKTMAGLTHAESVEMLKEPVDKFVLILEDGKEEAVASPQRKSFIYESPEPKSPAASSAVKNITNVVTLTKDGAGLGFSIEGGKDSPQGDLPLRIKKIFQGGAAEKSGELTVGDELLAINDISVTNLSRIETWSLMKKLPDGNVSIHIHR